MWELRDCGILWEYISSPTDCLRDFTIFLHREHLFVFFRTSHFYFIGNTCFLGDFLFLIFCSFPFPKDI